MLEDAMVGHSPSFNKCWRSSLDKIKSWNNSCSRSDNDGNCFSFAFELQTIIGTFVFFPSQTSFLSSFKLICPSVFGHCGPFTPSSLEVPYIFWHITCTNWLQRWHNWDWRAKFSSCQLIVAKAAFVQFFLISLGLFN